MSKKLICFSLWGDHEFYNYGALENAILAETIYPGWICRYYYLDNCNKKIIEELGKFKNVELVKMEGKSDSSNMFWRFIPAFEEDNVVFISRDTDSRLNIKEKLAVDEWLASDKDFHIMRDHYYHTTPILGGMWGCRNNILKPFREKFSSYVRVDRRGLDQDFLKDIIYPYVVKNAMVHASAYRIESFAKDFPKCDHKDFVGSYVRTAPLTFKHLEEKERTLNTLHEYQKM